MNLFVDILATALMISTGFLIAYVIVLLSTMHPLLFGAYCLLFAFFNILIRSF